ncbi:MAG: RNA polymerase subunit sigma [Planctomycetaceae bacterium]|nr:RNA polymerase subunit sigma [Planctomycetaceae bacterium]
MAELTLILQSIEHGDAGAAEKLLPLVYDELRSLAAAKMAAERGDHTLQPTALVHEAFLRLVGSFPSPEWSSRRYFFSAAANAMHRVLVDHARQKAARKRGGDLLQLQLGAPAANSRLSAEELLDLSGALERLEETDPQAAELAKLRVFTGLSVEEASLAMGVPARSGYRNWAFAKAWLFRMLNARAD